MKKLLLASAAMLALSACTTTEMAQESVKEMAAAPVKKVITTSPDYWGDWGIDQTAINKNIAAGDNFFMHVNGTWYDNFVMPDDRTRYGAFDLLREKSEQQVRFIIEDLAAQSPSVRTPAGKVASFYNAFMDTDAINAAGMNPAMPYLSKIAAMDNYNDLAKLFGSIGYASPFGAYVFSDPKDPDTNILQMGIGGLGLPDREYYLKDDDKSKELRTQYVALVADMLGQAGYDNAAAHADKVMALETEIAKADWDRAISRNPELTYNKLTWNDLLALSGDFPVKTFAKAGGIPKVSELLIGEIPPTDEEFKEANISDEDAAKLGGGFPAVMALTMATDLDTWKAYMTAHFLMDNSAVMPSSVDEAVFAFYGTALRGQPEQRPRWKRAVSSVQGSLGEAIGATYVERHFPPANKVAMDDLVANLRSALKANITDLTWMGDETKPMAFDKLDKFNPKVGYPNKFKSYDDMTVGNDALANSMAASKFSWEENIDRLGKEVDRDEWFMTPQTVNAYYNPVFNEIVFPAAILHPPFFNIDADPAINYGSIGAVIGHEMGHGFDDQGSKFNGDGVLANWWSEEDLTAFRALGSALVGQYNQYCPLEGDDAPCVNGQLTLGENIGDLGGISVAYRAYKMSLNGEEAPIIDGYSGDQRFFMAWAQVWRSKYRDEAIRAQLLGDPHSPALYRVNGIVRNIDEWYDAFGITEDDEMFLPKDQRVRIW